MAYTNSNYERNSRSNKRVKPPGDFDTAKDAKRIRERKEPTFQRTDKRQQWQDAVEY